MDSKNIQIKHGFSLVTVMAFMLSSAMLGASMMYVANKQSETSAGYYEKMTANDAASSAMSWFEGYIEGYASTSIKKASLFSWLENFDDNKDAKWYNGSSNVVNAFTVDSIKNASSISFVGKNIQAKVKIEKYDNINSIITLKFVGFGFNGGQKTKHGVYKLEGVNSEFKPVFNFTGSYLKYGFFGGQGFYSASDFTVKNSGAYIGDGSDMYDNSRLCLQASVDGDVRVMNSDQVVINQNMAFKGNLFINGDVRFNKSGEFGTANEKGHIFINGNANFDQPVDFLNKAYIMGFGNDVAQSLTFKEDAYINTNGKRIKSTPYFYKDAQIYSDILYLNSIYIDAGKKVTSPVYIATNQGVETNKTPTNSGTGEFVIGDVPVLTKEDVLDPAEYTQYEEVDIDYDKIRDMVDNKAKGIRLSTLNNLGIDWDLDKDGELDAEEVNKLYKDKAVGLSENGVLPIIVDENRLTAGGNPVLAFSGTDDQSQKLAAGVKVAMLIDVENVGKLTDAGTGWYMWKTEMQESSKENDDANSATLGVFVSDQGSMYYTKLYVNDFRGMIHDETHNIETSHGLDIQGALICKKGISTDMAVTVDYDNKTIGDFFNMGIFLDPETQNLYLPKGANDSIYFAGDTVSISNKTVIKPTLLFEY